MQKLHILIVEDEKLLALNLSIQLKSQGYDIVESVANTELAHRMLQQHPHINFLLLAIHLNDNIDGIDFYKQIKQKVPVIYLTSYTDEATMNKAIATHPFGYLIKPLYKEELFALLKLATLQHKESLQNTQNVIKLPSNYTFDTIDEILAHNGEQIKMSGKKLQLLKILINAKGKYVPFYLLEDALYQDTPPSESSLRTLVYRLRLELTYDIIQTERAYGIKLKMILDN